MPLMARELRITEETRGVLACVWQLKAKPSLVIDTAAVAAVKDALKCTVPDEVLALFAAEGASLAVMPALTLEVTTFFDATHGKGHWRTELQFDHVVFARLPSDDAEPLYASFRRGDSPTLALWHARSPQPGGIAITIEDYAKRRWGELPEVDGRAFKPVVDLPPPPPARQVIHPTFGQGRVLDQRDDKLRIDFGAAGIKTIAERFVKPRP